LALAISHIHNLITQQEIDAQVMTQNLTSERTREVRAVNAELEELRRKYDKQIDQLKWEVKALTAVVVVLVSMAVRLLHFQSMFSLIFKFNHALVL
jgi:phage host-nuclease inhibitor protein Gam